MPELLITTMKKILIIEDEEAVRENLMELLEAEEFEVCGAGDGCAGLDLVQQYQPDLI
ncbi:MAG: response regulator, partial [Coleofasciculus sp.]|uniref:response regulator n=1 Tax=Coleofasciculus sp. TaxID=3100458 RepID=UPI003A484B86